MVWIAIILGVFIGLVTFALMFSLYNGRFILSIVASGIIGISIFYFAEHYVVPEAELAYLQHQIKKSPIMNTVAKAEPQRFNTYLHDVRAMLYQGGEPSNALIMAHQLIHDIFPKYLSHASNASIDIYVRSTLTLYRQLEKANPAYVVYAEFPQTVSSTDVIPLLRYNYNRYIQNRQEAMQMVIRSAINDPQNIDANELGQTILTKIIQNLGDRYGADAVIKTIATPNDPTLARTTEAHIIMAFYQNILKQGTNKAGAIMRFIASEAEEKQIHSQ